MNNFDLPTAFVILGVIYVLMPLLVWVTLIRKRSLQVPLWCGGGVLLGIGAILIGLRGQIPPFVSITIANMAVFLGGMMRIQSLRIRLESSLRITWFVVAFLALAGVFVFIQEWRHNESLRVQFALLVDGLIFIYLSMQARRVSQVHGSKNALWIVVSYFLLGSLFTLRFVELISGESTTTILVSNQTTMLIIFAGILSSVVGNIAYLGMYLESSQQQVNSGTLLTLSASLEQFPASVVVTDSKARILYVNAMFSKITGYSAAEVTGKNPRFLQSGQTPKATYQEMWAQLLNDLTWEGELLNRRKNGELFWEEVYISPVKNIDGIVTHYVALKNDITSRRQAAESVRISELRFRMLADSARDVVWNMGPDGTITYVSPSVEAVRGFTPTEAMLLTMKETLTPDSLEISAGYFTQLQADILAERPPRSFRGELEYLCKDGSTFWGDVLAYPIVDAQGAVQILGVTRDIAEVKQRSIELEKEGHHLVAMLAQMDRQRSLGEMSAVLSHELNQPLTAILTNAQVAQSGANAGRFAVPQIVEFLDRIIVNTRRAAEIIDSIRSYIRPTENVHIPVDLQRLAGNVLGLIGPEASEHKVRIIFSPQGGSMWVNGDVTQLSQVLINIYRNAIEALSKSERREIYVKLIQAGNSVILSVCDTGPGLAPEIVGKVGMPFQTTKAEGLGLGLPISRRIIAQHHGTLNISNAGGGGVSVDITLPIFPESTEVRHD